MRRTLRKQVFSIIVLAAWLIPLPCLLKAESFNRDFNDGGGLRGTYKFNRVSLTKERGVQLRGEGALVSERTFGAGIYHVRFEIDESHKDFRYHVPCFVFGVQGADSLSHEEILGKLEFFEIMWRNTGQVEATHNKPAAESGTSVRQLLW